MLPPGKLEDAVSCFIFRFLLAECKQFPMSRLLSFLGSHLCGCCFGRAELPLGPAGKGEMLHQWLMLLKAGEGDLGTAQGSVCAQGGVLGMEKEQGCS